MSSNAPHPTVRAHSGGQERHLRIKVRARGPFPSAALRSRTGTRSARLAKQHACVTRSVAQVLFDPHEPREQTPFRYPIRADLSHLPALRPTAGQFCVTIDLNPRMHPDHCGTTVSRTESGWSLLSCLWTALWRCDVRATATAHVKHRRATAGGLPWRESSPASPHPLALPCPTAPALPAPLQRKGAHAHACVPEGKS